MDAASTIKCRNEEATQGPGIRGRCPAGPAAGTINNDLERFGKNGKSAENTKPDLAEFTKNGNSAENGKPDLDDAKNGCIRPE